VVSNCQRVEQRLRGMLVRSIARVNHRQIEIPRYKSGAPEELCRITIQSGFIASSVRTVSSSDPPFSSWTIPPAIHLIGAEPRSRGGEADARARRRLKKASATVFPRRVANFLRGCF